MESTAPSWNGPGVSATSWSERPHCEQGWCGHPDKRTMFACHDKDIVMFCCDASNNSGMNVRIGHHDARPRGRLSCFCDLHEIETCPIALWRRSLFS
jgi:hypothetical protein